MITCRSITPVRCGKTCAIALLLVQVSAAEPDEPAKSTAEKAPIVMEAFKVGSDYMPKLSFGISLNVWKDNNTQKVLSIEVGQVRPGSEAEKAGLVPRARLERIDGKPVQDFDASFLKGTPLNQLFVDRHNGDKVTVEFTVPGRQGSKIVTLTERRNLGLTLPSRWERAEN